MQLAENISFTITEGTRVLTNETLTLTDTSTATDFLTTTYSLVTADAWHQLAFGTINKVNYIFISGDTELQLKLNSTTASVLGTSNLSGTFSTTGLTLILTIGTVTSTVNFSSTTPTNPTNLADLIIAINNAVGTGIATADGAGSSYLRLTSNQVVSPKSLIIGSGTVNTILGLTPSTVTDTAMTINKFAVINTTNATAVYLKNVSGSTASVKVSLSGIQ